MPKLDVKMILMFLGLNALGAFLVWTGFQENNWFGVIIGGICLAFFGLGALLVLWRRFGPAPKPRPLVRRPLRESRAFTPDERAAFVRVHKALVKHGVFAPEAPSAQQLEAAAADYGGLAALDMPIDALFSTPVFDAEFDVTRYSANLKLQHSKVEQTPDVIASQITDIVALSQGALEATDIKVDYLNDTDVAVSYILNGTPMHVTYKGASKYMSTVLLHQLAVAYKRLDLGDKIAAIYSDANIYLTRLPEGSVEAITKELKIAPTATSIISWMDEPNQSFEAGS